MFKTIYRLEGSVIKKKKNKTKHKQSKKQNKTKRNKKQTNKQTKTYTNVLRCLSVKQTSKAYTFHKHRRLGRHISRSWTK